MTIKSIIEEGLIIHKIGNSKSEREKMIDHILCEIDLDPNIKINDDKFVKDKQIPNVGLFNENIEVIKNKISQMTIIEQVEIIKEEVKFLNRIYADLTKKLNFNFRDCEVDNKLMKFAFQKIYFVISIIKRKQVFIYLNYN